MREPRQIIIRPMVTEKSTDLQEQGRHSFVVAKDANKIEIRAAIEKLFEVKVVDVRTMNVRGKVRRMGRNVGRRPGYKKAIVTLAAGETIDVYEGI
jgi:large subunit ribosomal protein L23